MDAYALAYMETLFLALADGTRLRLLNLMRGREACVSDLVEAIGESQPKISRHLAYLRNSGLVETRRDGKHIYYFITQPEDRRCQKIFETVLGELAEQTEMNADPSKLPRVVPSARKIEGTRTKPRKPAVQKLETEPEREEYYEPPSHNELEEFLL